MQKARVITNCSECSCLREDGEEKKEGNWEEVSEGIYLQVGVQVESSRVEVNRV